ncbi:MAG: hypothetical protein GVY28_01980, partial [Alphaproteobacteria bacterium]|nr:hypothetical protein [Alphaproteobacteria bacterium]
MPDSAGRAHGGDLDAATARWGAPAGGWVDLSTGINPWPWPWPAPIERASLDATVWTRLPSA